MKRVRIIGSVLSIIAFLLCAWSVFELTGVSDIVRISLNLVYFFTLLIAFLCFRISLSFSNRINPIITGLSVIVISLSTYTWVDSSELLISGKITLGLIPLLLGTTLMWIVKANTKWSKIVQLIFGITAVTIASCVFIGVSAPIVYTVAVFGMMISSVAVLVYLIFARTN